MRYSNYIFTKGSIVFVRFPAASDMAYLNGRPLVVVSNPTHLMRTLIVCTTGTQDKPGIEVSFYNHMDKTFVGDAEISNIYPYCMLTIYTDQIVASIGQLDPYIMQEVDKAIDFHLGRSNEVPDYLKKFEDYICGVSHNAVRDRYIKKEGISSDLKPAYPYKREHRKTQDESRLDTPKGSRRVTNTVNKNSDVSSELQIPQVTNEQIMTWVAEPPKSEVTVQMICNNTSALMSTLDEESVALIISRAVPLALVAKKYNLNQRNASFLRIPLTNLSIRLALSILNGNSSSTKIEDYADYIWIAMALCKAFIPNKITGDTSAYDEHINLIAHKYKINTEDRRTWKSIENFYCE